MHSFKAKVIAGRGRGRQIGFPTANLAITDLSLAHGVYAVNVRLNRQLYQGLLHYGPKKTFGEPLSLEVHLINFNKNIYGRILEIEVGQKIRQVRKFVNIQALRTQIKKDLQELKKAGKKVEVRSKEI
mgnify:CR=1 FL=1